ncbi:MAG: shikimate dehydrogenase [Lachnospiraceae bacterium]|nr:shikimate dehydrogenase [Lachnospiraceae bacterium]
MRRFGLIGYPVEHSLSPFIHEYLYKGMGIDGNYDLFPIKGDPGSGLKKLHDEGILGLNVTVPHKSAVIGYLDGVDDLALSIGAVNTLIRTENGYYGMNTDIEGLKWEISEYGIPIKGRDVLILGAGGAARACAFMCLREQPSSITMINRNKEHALRIAEDMRKYAKDHCGELYGSRENLLQGPELSVLGLSETDKLEGSGYIAFQCTSVGLKPDYDSAVIEEPEFYKKIYAGIDLIYTPYVTRFMQLCRAGGAKAYNGLKMLLYQAVSAFEIWNDTAVPEELINEVYAALEAKIRRNVILTGFMGSGKSSVGKKLAELLGYEFRDTDSMIEESEQRSISSIFEESGEKYFRSLEEKLAQSIYEDYLKEPQKRFVLSVGGGFILSEKNREYLKKTGLVLYLKTSADVIKKRLRADESRPLLKNDEGGADEGSAKDDKIEALLEKREPVYGSACDLVIDTDESTIEDTALKGERRI